MYLIAMSASWWGCSQDQTWVRFIFFFSIQLSLRKLWFRFNSWLKMVFQELIEINSRLKMAFCNLTLTTKQYIDLILKILFEFKSEKFAKIYFRYISSTALHPSSIIYKSRAKCSIASVRKQKHPLNLNDSRDNFISQPSVPISKKNR